MSRPRFAVRTIKHGSVRIRGMVFRPDERHRAYDGRLDGQRWLFGLYWGPRNYDRYDAEGFASFVYLWGTEAAARATTEEEMAREWPGPNCIDGTFNWEWWNAEKSPAAGEALTDDAGETVSERKPVHTACRDSVRIDLGERRRGSDPISSFCVYGSWGELGPDFDVVLRAWDSPRVPIAVDPQVKRPTGAGSTGKPDTRD